MRFPLVVVGAISMVAAVSAQPPADEVVLKPTTHSRFSADPAQLWMVPTVVRTGSTRAKVGTSEFAAAVKLEVDGDFAKALPVFSRPALQQGTLADYAIYYQGFAELRLGRAADARRTFQSLQAKSAVGFLAEGAALREAE